MLMLVAALQGPAAPAVQDAAQAPSVMQEEGKKKDKKKDKKGAGGLVLGKGTGIVRAHLERAVAAAAAPAAAAAGTLGVTEGQLEGAAVVLGSTGLTAVEGVVTSHESAAVKMLEDVRVVVEANQARRKPKVSPQEAHMLCIRWGCKQLSRGHMYADTPLSVTCAQPECEAIHKSDLTVWAQNRFGFFSLGAKPVETQQLHALFTLSG
jgi:hypothetical protein